MSEQLAERTSRRRGGENKSRPRSAYDAALIQAKIDGSCVDLVLAADFATPLGGLLDADKTIEAKVCHVDTYAVEFEVMGANEGKKVWINKGFIAGVWVR
jgi:hypothetical protein